MCVTLHMLACLNHCILVASILLQARSRNHTPGIHFGIRSICDNDPLLFHRKKQVALELGVPVGQERGNLELISLSYRLSSFGRCSKGN